MSFAFLRSDLRRRGERQIAQETIQRFVDLKVAPVWFSAKEAK